VTPSAPSGAASASLLTPQGRGAIAVIAADGAAALAAVDAHFRAANRRRLEDQSINAIVFGHWVDAPSQVAEHSHGEEVVVCRSGPAQVEVHCHGGVAAAERILAALSAAGCCVDGWREWSHQGAICQLAAEAEIALASAPTLRTAAILLDQRGGALRREIEAIRSDLVNAPASSEAIRERLAKLLDGSVYGLRLTHPWEVAIAGRPNVGKSSLINALVGYERAIVFDQPGTTRDVLAAETAIDGWPVRLTDSAGLRTTDDELEAAGVDLALRHLVRADLVLWVLDATDLSRDEMADAAGLARRLLQEEVGADLATAPLAVVNKIDLVSALPIPPLTDAVVVSALTGQGLYQLLAAISHRLVPDAPQEGQATLFTERQVSWAQLAQQLLNAGDVQAAVDAVAKFLAGEPGPAARLQYGAG
jgi:tRNA modification GTPase